MDLRRVGRGALVSGRIYIEGGGDTAEGRARCREGFRRLLENCGFKGRMPVLRVCGSRNAAYDDFRTAHENGAANDYIALLVDSDDPVADINATWNHLRQRDDWQRPAGADNEQVLLMTTSMETWIVADRDALATHYGQCLQASALPPLANLENRDRHDVQGRLERATRSCSQPYAKRPHSFAVLGKLNPDTLRQYLPSFRRARRILDARL